MLRHFKVVHETVAVLSVQYELVPYVDDASRLEMMVCNKGFLQIRIHTGFMETTNIPTIISNHWPKNLPINIDPISYILKRIVVYPEGSSGIALWRKRLFRIMYRNAAMPLEIFRLPEQDTIAVSIRVSF
jgi:KUP system potassium uptake protein